MFLRPVLVAVLLAAPAVRAEKAAPPAPPAATATASTVGGLVISCGQGFTRDTRMEEASRAGTPESAKASIKQLVCYVAKPSEHEVRVNRTMFVPGTSVSAEDAAKGILSKLRGGQGMTVISEASEAATVSGLPAMRGRWEGEAQGQRTGLEFAFVADAETATLWMVQIVFARKSSAEAPASLDDLRAPAAACLDALTLSGR